MTTTARSGCSALICRTSSTPSIPGRRRSVSTTSTSSALSDSSASSRAVHRQHLVALQLERAVQRAEKDLVVLDQQEPSLHGVPPATRLRPRPPPAMRCEPACRGPARSRSRCPPPWRSTIFLTMDMPRPVPEGLVVKKGRKILSRSSGEIPTPSSMTSTTARSPSAKRSTVDAAGAAPRLDGLQRVLHDVGEDLAELLAVHRRDHRRARAARSRPATPRARPSRRRRLHHRVEDARAARTRCARAACPACSRGGC